MHAERFETLRAQCLPEIEKTLNKHLSDQSGMGIAWNAEMARYQFSSGGKRLRALVPCLIFDVCGKNPLDAIELGCAVEMVHNATLVHDDLQDGDVLRRGIPTVWKKYSPAQAINCGDAMFQFAHQMILELPVEATCARQMGVRLAKATAAVIEGQAQEFLLKDAAKPTVDAYLSVIRGKTAELFSACMGLSTIAIGKSNELTTEIEAVAIELGILFQIQDDLLDIYGDKGRDRKATDIAEGKVSFLIAQLVADASAADAEAALSVLRKPREETTDHDISVVIGLFERYRTKEKALARINETRTLVAALPWTGENAKLKELMHFVCELFLEPIRGLLAGY